MNSSPYNPTYIPESDNVTSAQETSKTTCDAGRSKYTQRDRQYRDHTEDTESSWDKRHLNPTAPPLKSASEQNLRDSATSSLIHCNPEYGRASVEELNIPGMITPKQRFQWCSQQVVNTLPKIEPPYPTNNPPYPTNIPPHIVAKSIIPLYSVTESGNAIGWAVGSGPPRGKLDWPYDLGSSAEPPNPTRPSRNVPPYPTNEPHHPAKSAPYSMTGPPNSLPHPVTGSESVVSWSANSGLSMSKIGSAYDSGPSADPPPPYSATEVPYPPSEKLLPISPENSGRNQMLLPVQPQCDACSTSASAPPICNQPQTNRMQDSNEKLDSTGEKICACVFTVIVFVVYCIMRSAMKADESQSNDHVKFGRF